MLWNFLHYFCSIIDFIRTVIGELVLYVFLMEFQVDCRFIFTSFGTFVLIFGFFLYRLNLHYRDSTHTLDYWWTRYTIINGQSDEYSKKFGNNLYIFEIQFTIRNFVIIWTIYLYNYLKKKKKWKKMKLINILFRT